MSVTELEQSLRQRLQDGQWAVPALVLTCTDSYATDLLLEITGTHLRTTVVNGSAPEILIDLQNTAYDTLGKLVARIRADYPKYEVITDAQLDESHASVDLERVGHVSIKPPGVTLRTRRFTDAELRGYLAEATQRHNPAYQVNTIPDGEQHLVLTLAQASALRTLATNAAKRRGLQSDVGTLLALVAGYESSYERDTKRLAKTLGPLRSDDDGIRDGDIVVGDFARPSLRSGKYAASYAKRSPHPPLLHDPLDVDIEDFAVTLRWRRSRESAQQRMELWRDTQPMVLRSRDASLQQTTSKKVWSSADGGANYRESAGVDEGTIISGYCDGFAVPAAEKTIPTTPGALQPNTVYYYRLYLFDTHGDWVASDVVSVRTKLERALFSRAAGRVAPVTGVRAGGTAITVTGTGFTLNRPKVLIGGNECTSVVYVSDTSITAVSPAVHAWMDAQADIVLVSNSGLRDSVTLGWTYT